MAMVSRKKIRQAVELLRQAANPKKIILFGSYGRGEPTDDSDVDLLVVEDRVEDVGAEMVRLMRVLSPLRIPAEVLVTSLAEFERWSTAPGSVFRHAAEEGKVLYDAA